MRIITGDETGLLKVSAVEEKKVINVQRFQNMFHSAREVHFSIGPHENGNTSTF